jgi:primosomal protein N' (replication factor Y)
LSQLELTSGSFEDKQTYFVDVILPIPVPKAFTYRVPVDLEDDICVGCRVVVPFGSRKVLTGIIYKIHETPPRQYEARYLVDLLEFEPTLNPIQLKFFKWLADYYMCTMGEVINIAIPSGLKISSESIVQLKPGFDGTDVKLSWEEEIVIQHLSQDEAISFERISDLVGNSKVSKVVKALLAKDAIIIFENIREKYSPKIEKRVRLSEALAGQSVALEDVFKLLSKKPKQTDVLLKYLQEVPVYENPPINEKGLSRSTLTNAGLSASSINTLIKNNVFEGFEIIVSRFESVDATKEPPVLSPAQNTAKEQILQHYESLDTVLLQGITGSGKTEIFIDLIKDVLGNGSQVLYLLPEIALTTQIVTRLKKVFGSDVGVYHSRFSDNERVEVWQGVQNGTYPFVVGVRSSVFLPFSDLGLVIIDEEHESSYKQIDPAPRYHARDAALMLAQLHHTKVLLGSATPSIESGYLAQKGKYGLVKLTNRYGESVLPTITTADLSTAHKKKTMRGNFTQDLFEQLKATFTAGDQAIIFQNRRGYAPYLSCEMCGWIPKCENCAVSLTYHMYQNELKCHYCGFKADVPQACEACGTHGMRSVNFGTEQLQEELQLMFPDHTIERMDLDTMKGKHAYDKLIDDFGSGKIDVIVGTQMVAKGLDFDRVALVGVMDVDRMIHFPDFRAQERAFQITTQVAGRAGRRQKPGTVVIQTYNPGQKFLQHVTRHDYDAFYNLEIKERQEFNYPPFVRIIRIILKHRDIRICADAAHKSANLLRHALGHQRVYGPAQPAIAKIRNRYLQEIYLKIERSANLPKAKQAIIGEINNIKSDKSLKGLIIVLDVDPN